MTTNTTVPAATEAFAEKFFQAILGAQEVQAAFIGDRLGYYQALAERGPLTSGELARESATHERYAREWLEHQTVSGYLEVIDAGAAPDERRYAIPIAHVAALAEPESLDHMLPFARLVGGLGRDLDALVEAFRSGGGVSWAEHGEDAREGQADANRPMFLNLLGHEHLRSLPDVASALDAGGRVADVGCGGGWSSIGVAEAFPSARVMGFDVDEPSIELARRNAAARGVDDRVSFLASDPAVAADPGTYDLVMALECIHDMPDPVSVLATMGRLVTDDGAVIVMDERVGEAFTGEADPVEQFMYGFSIMCCLADGMSSQPSVGTGTVMRPATLEDYARRAGFAGIEVLPIDDDFFRFYRLSPA